MQLGWALLIVAEAMDSLATSLRRILEHHFELEAVTGDSGEYSNVLNKLAANSPPSLIFLILSADDVLKASKLLQSIKAVSEVPIIAVLETGEPTDILKLLKLGLADFITSPLKPSEVLPRAWALMKPSNPAASTQPESGTEIEQLIGESPFFLTQVKRILTIARCDANVLVAGETGTGKELYSRAIHYNSARSGKPFVPVNCGAIPLELVENELFGHERGAFTSASAFQVGLVEEANGGTLFLDEIDCLPVYAQVKLLRFLQEKEYRPLGSAKMRRANVRIVAASNIDLQAAVEQGKVRRDLFYRLNTISLTLPPLRERREDVPLLAQHFLEKYSTALGGKVREISREALDLLMVQQWPGNIRELEHVIEQAVILCEGPVLHVHDLGGSYSLTDLSRESLQQAKAKEIARFEKNYVQGLLCACRGNITRAAQVAQKNRRAFWQLIQKYQIDVKKFKAHVR